MQNQTDRSVTGSSAAIAQLPAIDTRTPILIAGPTASGKSALALHIAKTHGGIIINADALQVYDAWPILTAQPSIGELAQAEHHLYGSIPHDHPYSTGDWVRDVAQLIDGQRPIIVGGTGLYFHALTQGLAHVPDTPAAIRQQGDALPLADLHAGLDADTRAQIDPQNRARVQRAWEVQHATGQSLLYWQRQPTAPLLKLEDTIPVRLDADPAWLTTRITQRCDQMLKGRALAEAREMLDTWSPDHPSSKAIGAAMLIDHIKGGATLDDVRTHICVKTRQYAKRQRTWLRSKMGDWHGIGLG